MHVDGFRFDLASILTRDEWGLPLRSPHTLYSIETDPVLANTKLIAEPWDAAGLYQVGSFVGDHWMEWNGRFRDDIRAVVKGDPNSIRLLSDRLLASPDIYGHEEREPEQSINFVTCHDGFTLNDVVSYEHKHNEDNGEDNRDGHNHNVTWNHGVEGPTDDPAIDALRHRQIKNLLTLTLFSIGTPMLLMGDEVRRSQRGNNNAYCQDNELGWFDWRLVDEHPDLFRFTRELVRWRLRTRRNPEPNETLCELLLRSHYEWHGVQLGQPDWSSDSHTLALTVTGAERRMHLMMNFYWEDLTFQVPRGEWRQFLDTAAAAPRDIYPADAAPPFPADHRLVTARSVALLID
jgi:glycogen operon protein